MRVRKFQLKGKEDERCRTLAMGCFLKRLRHQATSFCFLPLCTKPLVILAILIQIVNSNNSTFCREYSIEQASLTGIKRGYLSSLWLFRQRGKPSSAILMDFIPLVMIV